MAKTLIILRRSETIRESIVSDCFTVGSLIAATLLGTAVQSVALQWIGGILILLWILARQAGEESRMTIDQARAELDRLAALDD